MNLHCLITGTTSGIGRHLAALALRRGALVVSIGDSGLVEHDRLIEQDIDVRDDESIQTFIDRLPIAKLDVLINNAAVFPDPDLGLSDLNTAGLLEAFEINAAAPLRIVRHSLTLLERSSRPTIINLNSNMGLASKGFQPGSYAYRMSKAALAMLSFCLAEEFPWITSFCVHPGHVKTTMGGTEASIEPDACARSLWRLVQQPPPSGRFVDADGRDLLA